MIGGPKEPYTDEGDWLANDGWVKCEPEGVGNYDDGMVGNGAFLKHPSPYVAYPFLV